MCGLERDLTFKGGKRKEETYEDTRTWNLLEPIWYRLFGYISKWMGYDSLKWQHQGHTRWQQAMLLVQQE